MHLLTAYEPTSNITFIRSFKRLTYKELAEAIGCTEGQAKSYELRGVVPPLEILCNLADFSGLTLDVLVRHPVTEKTYGAYVTEQLIKKTKGKSMKAIDLLEVAVQAVKAEMKK